MMRTSVLSNRSAVLITTVAAAVCLAIWWLSPIYPDEVAFRQQLGRIIPDDGVIYGLYGLCESNFKTVPLVLAPMGRLLATAMQTLSPSTMRILSFAAVIGVIFTTSRLIAPARNPGAALLTLASFVGVAGSGLIFVRYEFALEVHLLSCLTAALLLQRPKSSVPMDAAITLGLLAGAALSVWSHIQGLIFLPLTAYLIQRIATRRFGPIGIATAIVPFLLLAPAALELHRSTCPAFPEIESYWRKMVFDPSSFSFYNFPAWIVRKWWLHAENFTYATPFPIHYLPDLPSREGLLLAFNTSIEMVVGVICLGLVILLLGVLRFAIPIGARPGSSFRGKAPGLPRLLLTLSVLIAGPTAFLFIYDEVHAFYRSFYINHFATLALALAASSIPVPHWRKFSNGIGVSVATMAIVSMTLNLVLLFPPLWRGYEGPSLSVFRDWRQTKKDVEALARECRVDLDRGRIIVDDLTQDAVFTRPVTFPITYIGLQASLIGKTVMETAQLVRPNAAILRCPYVSLLGVKPQSVRDGLCCIDFQQN